MAKIASSPPPAQPDETINPTSPEDYSARGWAHYSKKEYFRAESDFQKSIELAPDNLDHVFGLGLAQQASGRPVEATETFEKLLRMLANPGPENKVRYHMLSRLVRGHINLMKTGDWKLDE